MSINTNRIAFLTTVAMMLTVSSLFGQESADLILTDAVVITVDDEKPKADWIAISSGKILAIGVGDTFQRHKDSDTKILSLSGQTVIPGFIESHAHYMNLGQAQMMLDLTTANSWDEVVKQVEVAVADSEPGEWIVGRGWHQEKWEIPPQPNIDGYPTHDTLSRISPNNPVLLTHASGHMCFANGYAMREANVSQETRDPSGGEIVRDVDGNPVGVFRETAQGLIGIARGSGEQKQTAEQRLERKRKAADLAAQACLRNGITSFQDAGSSFGTIEFLKKLADEEKLPVRLYVMIRDGNLALERRLPKSRLVGYADNHLTVRSIKRSIDGALGPHGAWLLAPYDDMPSSSGLNTASVQSVQKTAELAAQNDFQLCVHAIGDKANRVVLDIFQETMEAQPSDSPRRWRVEHAQHLNPDDIPRFAELGVIASMQGIHCTSDAPYVLERLGARRAGEGAYVWKSLLDSGAIICNGTDAPVEPIDPIASYYASVTRKGKKGNTFFEEQCMSREQALRSYTLDAAFAAFEENIKGSITAGKLADLVVLSQDITKCDEAKIQDTKVLYTIVGGKILFDSTIQSTK